MPIFKAFPHIWTDEGGTYTSTYVYNPNETYFACSPEKLYWCTPINTSSSNDTDNNDQLDNCDPGYMRQCEVDLIEDQVSEEFDSLEDALEYWQGNYPF